MSSIHIERNHSLGKAEARKKIEDIASQMKNRLGVKYNWNGDTLQFDRSGVNGTIMVGDKNVQVDAELGMMMGAFKGQIESQVRQYLDSYFG
jgi:putative polyhydroxyalkanoate system protein